MLCQKPVILVLQTLHTFGLSVLRAQQKQNHFISVRNTAVHDSFCLFSSLEKHRVRHCARAIQYHYLLVLPQLT